MPVAGGGPARCGWDLATCYWYGVMNPKTSDVLQCWNTVMWLVCGITAFYVPFEFAFSQADWETCRYWIEGAMDCANAVDIALQFCTAIPLPDNPLVYDYNPVFIAKTYLSGWFWVDILSFFPVNGFRHHYLRLCRLLRLRRVAKIANQFHESCGVRRRTLSLVMCVGVILTVSHWIACLWGTLARLPERTTWLTALRSAKGGDDDMYASALSIYVISLYWSCVTVTGVGYGDITPQTEKEYGAATFCIFVSAVMWAYFIGEICAIATNLYPHEVKFKQRIDDLNCFMEKLQLPWERRRDLRRYLFEKKGMSRLRDMGYLLSEMSPALRALVAARMHEPCLSMVWYVQILPREAIARIAVKVRVELYAPKERVPVCRAVHIVRRGFCMMQSRVLGRGDVWGKDMVLSRECLRRPWSVHSITHLEVAALDHESLVDSVSEFPDASAKLRRERVRLALGRAFVKIACGLKALAAIQNVDVRDLDLTAWKELYVELLLSEDKLRHNSEDSEGAGEIIDCPRKPRAVRQRGGRSARLRPLD